MPSRKQRRRREKLQRHEYEYVVETDEGEEVVESLSDLESEQPPKPARNGKGDRGKQTRAGTSGKGAAAKGPVDRRGRPIQKPSLERSLKRALIFLPIFVVFLYVAAPNLTTVQKLTQGVFLMIVFIPVTYLADRMVHRLATRRWEQQRRGGRK